MSRRALLPLLALAWWALGCGAAPARGAGAAPGWRLPVDGGRAVVAGRFAFDPAHAYAAGARRGVDLRAAPGLAVRAPCSGRVSFAGRLPARGGAVTLRCGRLVATVLGLGGVGVRRGRAVVRGERLGAAGGAGRVRLGARRDGARHGYLDPLRLLGGAGPAPPLAGPRGVRRGPPLPRAGPPRRIVRAGRARGGRPPVVAWLGAALLAGALGAGVTRRRSARWVVSARPCPSTSPRRSTT